MSDNDVTLIRLTKKHLRKAIKLLEIVFCDEDESVSRELKASLSEQNFKSYVINIDRHVKSLDYFVAIDKSENVLGIIGIYTLVENFEDTDWIGWYCVSKKHRGKGIGLLLLDFAIALARSRKKKYLCLYTSTVQNEKKAQELYEKNGFYIIKRVKEYDYEILYRRKEL